MAMIPYHVKASAIYPKYFHNAVGGYPDQFRDVDRILSRYRRQGPTLLAEFNACVPMRSFCRLSMVAESQDFSNPSQPIQLAILGLGLSVPSNWIIPDWTQAVDHPFLSYKCGSSTGEIDLANTVGFNFGYDGVWGSNHFVLAPYEIQIPNITACRGERIKRLTLGFKRLLIATGQSQFSRGEHLHSFAIAPGI